MANVWFICLNCDQVECEVRAREATFKRFVKTAPIDESASESNATNAENNTNSQATQQNLEQYYFTFDTLEDRRSFWYVA